MDEPCNEFCDARICVAIRQASSATIPIAGHRQRGQVRWKSAVATLRASRSLNEAPLSFLNRVFLHDRNISVCLVSNHLPASSKARQNRSFGPALRQEHETMTFLGMSPATACFAYFPLGVKIGQWRPARCTTREITKVGDWSRLHQSMIPEME
jgi:hypothetical protein